MPKIFMRRGRILPGPLKILQRAERRGPVPVKALALTSAAIAAGLLLLPQLSPRLSVDPTPMVEFADASDAEAPFTAEAAALVEAAPVEPVATPAAPPPSRLTSAEPVRLAPEPATARLAVAAPARPPVDTSLFQLDLLPVLQAEGADLDTVPAPAAGPQKLARATSRRTSAANRDAAAVAIGGPAQP